MGIGWTLSNAGGHCFCVCSSQNEKQSEERAEMAKTIVIIGTLDTKGEEFRYVKELIEKRGHKTIVVDVGILGEPPFQPDITHEEVAEAAGTKLKEIIALGEEGKAIAVMTGGASKIAQKLHSEGRLDGIIALGGSMGAWLALAVMRSLPLDVPKLMVTTEAFSGFITPDMVGGSQMLTDCVAGLWGLNTISRVMLENAASAITGMVENCRKIVPQKPLIGVTTLGSAAHKYTWQIKPLLESRGYEMAVFHVGAAGRNLEPLIEEGLIAGVLDLCLMELTGYLLGTLWNGGPNRLEAAGRKGIPQVVAPGGIDFVCWAGPPETLPPRYRNRPMHAHNPNDTVVMATTKEKARLGKLVAQKLNRATGPTAALIPAQGFDEADRPGGIFYDPEGRRAFITALKRHIRPGVKVVELDAHINDPQFAREAVTILDDMMKGRFKS
jgi:uncharacterized protein (UPF0261 family)